MGWFGEAEAGAMKNLIADFLKFDADNPHIYNMVKEYAFRVMESGLPVYSIASIIESIRYHENVTTYREDEFLIANAHRAFYARKFMVEYPDCEGFFRLAESVADELYPKVAHVRKGKQTRNHECHWPGCTTQVPPAMWGCRKHWYMLPADIRDRIWRAYRAGQEFGIRPPSESYINAARAAQEWIAKDGPL